ncbi:hypothetical protein SAMD00019534_003210 [Acytostelium subglobosum LB1]|uniref:hypothetical protein n=1 Tax=Acytostelium subglobosum LB1 TaxID=1410327 RepID=UPI000644A2FD|nr:hypothetical protein SAMD00019534_003210 [Acytostelium subglobosum LB1]GAM17146.1 hypothetical protein SAMD00019534_003210 [Acytostelium subglobosum LB1]|eukprot:XP_012759208.1 hypothetical protein SAMD00019534_003210 [Acytostelium subglobosum LB1]
MSIKYLTSVLLVLFVVNQCIIAHENNHHIDNEVVEKLQKISSLSAKISCELCEVGAVLFDGFLERNASVEEVIKTSTDICSAMKIQQPDVCAGIMFAYAPIVYQVLIETDLTPTVMCHKLRFCTSTESKMQHYNELNQVASMAALLQTKPNYKDTKLQKPKMDTPYTGIGYILQLTDIHYDPYYLEGSDPLCGKPLCCRNGTGSAGFYGDYSCDIPLHTVKAIFEQILEIGKTMPIRFVVHTGDNPPHDVWMQDEARQISSTDVLASLISTYFPDTIVLPSVGNHESWPSDEYILPKKQWLLDTLHSCWTPFLDDAELESVKKAGYYTTLLQTGLRVISLNTFDADILNFYNLLKHSNMDIKNNQTDWFINVLEQAEANNEKVIVIGHIPCTLKSDPNDHWCEVYQAIVERFSQVITAQFYGHTHYDQLVVFSDTATHTKPTGMNYVAPSMTTYMHHEPSFRLYEFDFDTYEVTNYYQYHANLSQANEPGGNLTFTVAYSAKELFDMPDLSPQSWWNVAQEFKTNATLFDNYYKHLANSPFKSTCDDACRKKWTCEVFGVTSQLFDQCLGV